MVWAVVGASRGWCVGRYGCRREAWRVSGAPVRGVGGNGRGGGGVGDGRGREKWPRGGVWRGVWACAAAEWGAGGSGVGVLRWDEMRAARRIGVSAHGLSNDEGSGVGEPMRASWCCFFSMRSAHRQSDQRGCECLGWRIRALSRSCLAACVGCLVLYHDNSTLRLRVCGLARWVALVWLKRMVTLWAFIPL